MSEDLTLDEALLEIERLRALFDGRWKDAVQLRLKSAGPVDGMFQFELQAGILPLIAEHLASEFKRAGGENYVSFEINHDELGPLTLTMQRRFGKMPAQVAREANERADALQIELDALRAPQSITPDTTTTSTDVVEAPEGARKGPANE